MAVTVPKMYRCADCGKVFASHGSYVGVVCDCGCDVSDEVLLSGPVGQMEYRPKPSDEPPPPRIRFREFL